MDLSPIINYLNKKAFTIRDGLFLRKVKSNGLFNWIFDQYFLIRLE